MKEPFCSYLKIHSRAEIFNLNNFTFFSKRENFRLFKVINEFIRIPRDGNYLKEKCVN